MTLKQPIPVDGPDDVLLSHIRDTISRNLRHITALINQADLLTPVDAPELKRVLTSLDVSRDSLIKMETKIATQSLTGSQTAAPAEELDLAQARDQISSRLDKLRSTLRSTEVP